MDWLRMMSSIRSGYSVLSGVAHEPPLDPWKVAYVPCALPTVTPTSLLGNCNNQIDCILLETLRFSMTSTFL